MSSTSAPFCVETKQRSRRSCPGGPATTPLTELLAKVDPAADLTVVSTGNDRLTKAREYFGPPIQAFAGVAHGRGPTTARWPVRRYHPTCR